MQIIDKLVIVQPQVKIWTGSTKLDPEDVGGYELPKKFANLGNKKLVPRKTINPLETLKKRTERMLERYGVKLIGGYAVAEEHLDTITEKLRELQSQFNAIKTEFIQEFSQHVDQQCDDFPAYAKGIREAAQDVAPYLEHKFGFDFKAYKLIPPGQDGDDANSCFPKDEEFVSQAVLEIGKEADEALTRLSQQDEPRQTFLTSLRNYIRSKLLNLSSLDNRQLFGSATIVVDMVLGEMPPKGPIDPRGRRLLTALLMLLRSLNDEFHCNELIAGNYNDPEALMSAMGCNQAPAASQSKQDDASSVGEVIEQEEQEEEFVWF